MHYITWLVKSMTSLLSERMIVSVSVQLLIKQDFSTGHKCPRNWEFVIKRVKVMQSRALNRSSIDIYIYIIMNNRNGSTYIGTVH